MGWFDDPKPHECGTNNHRFEARYDESFQHSLPKMQIHEGEDLARVIEAFKVKTYVHDICTRCGKTVYREEKK